MRITGGKARSLNLATGKSTQLRPATDKIRESIFSSIGPLIQNARVLDLFAGTGAYALEAISRGAQSADFVENDRQTLPSLKKNIAAVSKSIGSNFPFKVISRSALQLELPGEYELIFIDPPYPIWSEVQLKLLPGLPDLLSKTESSRIICEAPADFQLSIPSMQLVRKLGGKKHDEPSASIFSFYSEVV